MIRSLNKLENYKISASDFDIGHVKDFYFDDRDWVLRYLVVETGSWLAGREVLISPISIQKPDWKTHTFSAAITREQVRNSPDIDTHRPVTRQHEVEYLDYYGYPGYWGGAGLWGGGMLPFGMNPGSIKAPSSPDGRDIAFHEGLKAERARHRGDDPHLRSCNAVVGYHIHASDDDVGHVAGFLVDDETWAIRFLVVDTSNWWLGHKVLIAPQWIVGIQWTDRSVTVDLSRESVKAAPVYDASAELKRDRETELYAHYGRLSDWRTGARLEREI